MTKGSGCAETLFFDYHRQVGLQIKVARIFTYGARMHPNDGRVVSNFIVSALTGKPVTLYGDGSQTRSFCHVDDTIEGLIRLMNSPDQVTGPINIGNPDEMSVLFDKLLQRLRGRLMELDACNRHVVLKLRHIARDHLIRARESIGVLGFPDRGAFLDKAVERAAAPGVMGAADRIAHPVHLAFRHLLEPLTVKSFRPGTQHHRQDIAEVSRGGFATLFKPQAANTLCIA
jgi:hypothetical protein